MRHTPRKGTKPRKDAGAAARVYSFSLILHGASELTPEIADALFEAGCDDALIGSRDGVLFADFDREAPSAAQAIASAIQQVESAGVGLTVVRVEPDELISTAEIADRVGLNRETIRLYALGRRGPGNFPPPVARLRSRSPLYRWTDVAPWLARYAHAPGDDSERGYPFDSALWIGLLNAALDLRRLAPGVVEQSALKQFDFMLQVRDERIAVDVKSRLPRAPARRRESSGRGTRRDQP
jgi:hypothetical protein